MKKVVREGALAFFLILIICTIYICDKNNGKMESADNNILLEEAKFYGIDLNIRSLGIDVKHEDIERKIYVEEAKFQGIPISFFN
ncbi:hypothetical protein R9X47_17250 [Wukongibacter baidiensis]|uniref:hypothetical protein n=1 Tax=Wukongibacter baidiensis TaxID=1723361 RepID=UPI003D7F8B26